MSEARDYRRHDLTGQRFGRLVAVKRGENDKNNHTTWVCKKENSEIDLTIITHCVIIN